MTTAGLEALAQDVRNAVRGMARTPGFTALVAAVLAIGIGAGTTVFSIMNTLFLRPLRYPHAERLVLMGGAYTRGQQVGPMAPVRHRDYLEWRKQAQSFERIAAYRPEPFVVSSGAEPKRIRGESVDQGYFEMLGVQPQLGRAFSAADFVPGAPAVLVVSEEYWQRTLDGRPDVIGTKLRVDGAPATVIGVMPGRLRATLIEGGPRLWKPLIPTAAEITGERGSFAVMGRLKAGVSVEAARAEMAVIGKRLAAEHPEPDRDPTIRVEGLRQTLAWAASAPAATVLKMVVACLLLISCMNAASLLLARAAERQKELALRVALGSGRWRLVRQFLIESAGFALAGGVAGIGLATLATGWCSSKMGALLAREGIEEFTIDGRVLAFALAASAVTAVIFGILPALRGSNVNVAGVLKQSGHGNSAGPGRQRLTRLLVASEVALSVVVVTSGGLLLYSVQQYWRFDWRVPLEHRLAMKVTPIERVYDTTAKRARFYGEFLARARAIPGVESAALVNAMPVHGDASSASVRTESTGPVQVVYRTISLGYHATAGAALRAGRTFTEADTAGRLPVALVSESLAGKLWPGKEPIGEPVQVNGNWATVVGITVDLPQSVSKAPSHEVCVPYLQADPKSMRALLLVSGDAAGPASGLRAAVKELDPDLPPGEVQTLRAAKEQLGAPYEFIIGLLGWFAVSALLLAGAGIYSVTSRAVAMRTREMGIRIALGADTQRVLGYVLKGGLRMTVVGTVVGSALAFVMVKVVLAKIWWMTPVSPVAWVVPVALLMAGLALGASVGPARRATKVDVVVALRAE
jgi:predicted permease